MIFEFASTECLRPAVCARGWASFHQHLLGVDWERSTLYLNIDPTPADAGQRDRYELIAAARSVFGHVEVNTAAEPHFTKAVRWAWTMPRGPFFFYLQADWVMTELIEVEDLVRPLLDGYDAVNLRAYLGDREERLCLSPVMLRSDTARRLAGQMVDTVGPEAQLRSPEFRTGGRSLGVGVRSLHYPTGVSHVVVKDIGRDWRDQCGLVPAGGSSFVRWSSVQEEMSRRAGL